MPLQLSDSLIDFSVRYTDALALIEVGDGPFVISTGVADIWAIPPRGNVGSLLAGNLTLGPNSSGNTMPITRIAFSTDAETVADDRFLVVNDNITEVNIGDYFVSDLGSDLVLSVQTEDYISQFPASSVVETGGNYVEIGHLPDTMITLFENLSSGDRMIIGFSRPFLPIESEKAFGGLVSDAGVRFPGFASSLAFGGLVSDAGLYRASPPGRIVNVRAEPGVDQVVFSMDAPDTASSLEYRIGDGAWTAVPTEEEE